MFVKVDSNTLILFIFSSAVLAISPGPDNIFVLIQSVTNGAKYGIATVLGLVTGCLVHTTLVAFGVSAVIKNNDTLYLIIKIVGALYLLYLAYKVFKSDASINLSSAELPKKSVLQLYKQGFIMNVLNPKVSIFFLAFFPGFLFSTSMNTISQFYVLGVLFMIVTFIVFSSIALLAGLISNYLKKHKQTSFYLKWLQIIVFIGIAIFILFSDK